MLLYVLTQPLRFETSPEETGDLMTMALPFRQKAMVKSKPPPPPHLPKMIKELFSTNLHPLWTADRQLSFPSPSSFLKNQASFGKALLYAQSK